jgi:hypothetical protein
VNWSCGVDWSDGVNRSYGVNWSYGVLNSFGVDCSIFEANKPRTYRCFGKDITEDRYDEIWETLHTKLNGWFPKFHNMFELYLKAGSDWKLTPVGNTVENTKEKAWSDMPVEAIEYVKSLPEFDSEMFFEITGIDVKKKGRTVNINGKVIEVSQELIDVIKAL